MGLPQVLKRAGHSGREVTVPRDWAWFKMLGVALFRRLMDGQINLWAMSLVYSTLLSLVPLLAVSFSVLKGFGVHNELEPLLLEALAPLGSQAQTISDNIIGFVNNLRVGVLGTVGIAFLFYTVIALLQKIESAFNSIWGVAETRSVSRRFSDYLSVILVGPVLVFAAVGMATAAMDQDWVRKMLLVQPMGWLIVQAGRLLPLLMVSAAFGFAYMFMTNTRVRIGSAAVGGLAAGVLWTALGAGFTSLVVDSSNYSAVYSGFAAIILFMLWLNFGWLIILIGAQVAYYWQYPRRVSPLQATGGALTAEQLSLELMVLIAGAHREGQTLWVREALIRRFPPQLPVDAVLGRLESQGLVARTQAGGYVPTAGADRLALRRIVEAGRDAPPPSALAPVADTMATLTRALNDALGQRTLAELLPAARAETSSEVIQISPENPSTPP